MFLSLSRKNVGSTTKQIKKKKLKNLPNLNPGRLVTPLNMKPTTTKLNPSAVTHSLMPFKTSLKTSKADIHPKMKKNQSKSCLNILISHKIIQIFSF